MVFKLKYHRQQWVPYLFLLPAMLFLLIFFIYSLLNVFYISLFTTENIFGDLLFVGLKNYLKVFQSSSFWQAVRFVTLYTVLVTPTILLVALFLADLCSKEGFKSRGFFRGVYFAPTVLSFAVC